MPIEGQGSWFDGVRKRERVHLTVPNARSAAVGGMRRLERSGRIRLNTPMSASTRLYSLLSWATWAAAPDPAKGTAGFRCGHRHATPTLAWITPERDGSWHSVEDRVMGEYNTRITEEQISKRFLALGHPILLMKFLPWKGGVWRRYPSPLRPAQPRG